MNWAGIGSFRLGRGWRVAAVPQDVLLIEPDPETGYVFSTALERIGVTAVHLARDASEAEWEIKQRGFDLMIGDWSLLPGPLSGSASGVPLPVVVLTDCDESDQARRAKANASLHVIGVVSKEQPIEGILEQVKMLYGNFPLTATG